jgi:hypothetical protein
MAIDLNRMTLPEIFQHVSDLPASRRADALKKIGSLIDNVRILLHYTYHKNVVMELPEGIPPYRPMDIPKNMGLNRLPAEMKRLQYFLPSSKINQIKREAMFIDILESLSPEEALLLLMVKNKKLEYKGITRKLVEEVFPEILQGETN